MLADISGTKKAYRKAEIEELNSNSRIKNIRDWYRDTKDFKKGYQLRTNIIKDEKGDLVADSHSILARWRNYFSQVLNVHCVNDVRQTEIQTRSVNKVMRLPAYRTIWQYCKLALHMKVR